MLCALQCHKSSTNPEPVREKLHAYPLQTGNRWDYHRTYTEEITSVALDTTIIPDTLQTHITVEVLADTTLFDTLTAYKLRETWQDPSTPLILDHYYVQDQTGLYLWGQTNSNRQSVLPKSSTQSSIHFCGQRFRSMDDIWISLCEPGMRFRVSTEVRFRTSPLPALNFPLQVSSEWILLQTQTELIKKTVTRRLEQQTHIGLLQCYEIRWSFDVDRDGTFETDLTFVDTIGDVGLSTRTLTYHNVRVLDEAGKTLYTFDARDVTEITSLYLH
jgi:hypothetical protein